MHNALRKLLRDAAGESSFVIAANIDIRGFSSFFSDSSQAAAYLSSAYTRILDEYFPIHSFFKPTGDGLLIVRIIGRPELKDVVGESIAAALRLDNDFAKICEGDDLINFPTPDRVGIGISRGTATKIANGKKVLDFSGYPLNLCSRLMDLARPRGVVFDESMGHHLLPKPIAREFRRESVYVKGLADLSPIGTFVTSNVVIPEVNQRPIGAEPYHEKPQKLPFRTVKQRGRHFAHVLTHWPMDTNSVRLNYEYPSTDSQGRRSRDYVQVGHIPVDHLFEEVDGPNAMFDYSRLVERLQRAGVKRDWPVKLRVSYSIPMKANRPDDFVADQLIAGDESTESAPGASQPE